MAEKGEPGWTLRLRVWSVVNLQDTTNHIPINLDAECQCDLLGDAGTAPVGIPPFHLHNGLDEFFARSFWARSMAVPGRKQLAIFSFLQQLVEIQQSGRLQNDGRTKKACWAHEKGAQAGYDPIRRAQVGSPLAAAIQDQKLMEDQYGFGDN
jgi:hypothetical protein